MNFFPPPAIQINSGTEESKEEENTVIWFNFSHNPDNQNVRKNKAKKKQSQEKHQQLLIKFRLGCQRTKRCNTSRCLQESSQTAHTCVCHSAALRSHIFQSHRSAREGWPVVRLWNTALESGEGLQEILRERDKLKAKLREMVPGGAGGSQASFYQSILLRGSADLLCLEIRAV